jgi:pSer/pThr/pTyr-binding forkhead associated (FHA) protein
MTARVKLKVTGGPLRGEEFVFTGKTRCVVGRSSGSSLHLPGTDPTASRRHCLLEIDTPAVWVQDLGSLNGTFVNGESIGRRDRRCPEGIPRLTDPPHPLLNGDELCVGNTALTVEIGEGDSPEVGDGGSSQEAYAAVG